MIYAVKRIDEDLDFGCEERAEDTPVMAVVTLMTSSGEEVTVKMPCSMSAISTKVTRSTLTKRIN